MFRVSSEYGFQSFKPFVSSYFKKFFKFSAKLQNKSSHQERLKFFSNEKKDILSYIPHKFSSEEAARLFVEVDNKRLFAPINMKSMEGLTPFTTNPLKKVFLPIFGINATIHSTHYRGQYGVDRLDSYTDRDGKRHTRVVTDWYNISGSVGSCSYSEDEDNMTIYGGLNWNSNIIESAMDQLHVKNELIPFDIKSIDSDAIVDPFVKKHAIAQQTAIDRIWYLEKSRAKRDISDRVWCNHTHIDRLNINYDKLTLSSYLLPAYILQYEGCPPRVMSAMSNQVQIVGPAPLSVTKFMTAITVGTTALSFLFPQASIPLRVGVILMSSATSAFWAKYSPSLRNSFHERILKKESEYNETVAESPSDKKRRMATEGATQSHKVKEQNAKVNVELATCCEILGIDPQLPITEEAIRAAFNQKIKEVHPDHQNGSSEKARELIHARNTMLKFTKKKKSEPEIGTRHFSTSKPEKLVKLPPSSLYDPRARKLIDTVLVEKDYKKALMLVEEEEISPDSHDKGENTLLVEAVKRGTLKDMEFIIDKLGASIDSSCDCPAHRTALHYASMNGYYDKVKLLLDRKANPNLITSHGETAYDLAIANGHQTVAKLIASTGGIQHKGVKGSESLWKKIFGYGSDERTLLLKEERKDPLVEKSKVIQLPSPDKNTKTKK